MGEPGTAPREIELKLAVPAAALPLLRRRLAALGPARQQQLETIYFDTADRLLARHAMALRLRRVGRRWLQTLKAGDARAAFSSRGEWEAPVVGGRLDLAALADTPLPALLAAQGTPLLQAQFSTRFARSLWLVRSGAARIEVALDRGAIVAGGAPAGSAPGRRVAGQRQAPADAAAGRAARSEPLLELELELKAGPPAALFALAQQLVGAGRKRALPLLPFTESKAARGHRLAAGGRAAPLAISARELAPGWPPTPAPRRRCAR